MFINSSPHLLWLMGLNSPPRVIMGLISPPRVIMGLILPPRVIMGLTSPPRVIIGLYGFVTKPVSSLCPSFTKLYKNQKILQDLFF